MIESVEKGFTDIEAFNYLPKPLYDLVIHTIAVLILRVFSPVIHIDISQSTHKKLHSKKCQTVDKKNYGHKNPVWKQEYFLPLVRFHRKFWWDPVVLVQKIPSGKNVFKNPISSGSQQPYTLASGWLLEKSHMNTDSYHHSLGFLGQPRVQYRQDHVCVHNLFSPTDSQVSHFETSLHFPSHFPLLCVISSLQQVTFTWERNRGGDGIPSTFCMPKYQLAVTSIVVSCPWQWG